MPQPWKDIRRPELLKGYTRPAGSPREVYQEQHLDWQCRRGHHDLCPCTRLVLEKTGEVTREFKAQGEPLTQIMGMKKCTCPCHNTITAQQIELVEAVKLVCPTGCTFDEPEEEA